MNDTSLYQQILGLKEPWHVESVALKKAEGIIEIQVVCKEELWACPECGRRMHKHDTQKRTWRHLDSCQFKTLVTAEVPRVKCLQHGTQMVRVPWAEARSRFTALFERLAVDVMQECSTLAACGQLNITWDEADGIKQRAISRGLKRRKIGELKRLCVDEKAVGWGHEYVTIVSRTDADKTCVLALEDERKQESLERFWRTLSPAQLSGIESVSMDMWEPYLNATVKYVPEARRKIVYDRFHVAMHMNKALDEVRRQEQAVLAARGDSTLKGTRQLWLFGLENLPGKWAERFQAVRAMVSKTGRAWKIKEMLRELWESGDAGEAGIYFKNWYRQAMKSALEPVKKVAVMLRKHWAQIESYFVHRQSNAPAEGINSRIQQYIQRACGYRNRERFKRDVLFHLGGLDLSPEIMP
jgi:transposase